MQPVAAAHRGPRRRSGGGAARFRVRTPGPRAPPVLARASRRARAPARYARRSPARGASSAIRFGATARLRVARRLRRRAPRRPRRPSSSPVCALADGADPRSVAGHVRAAVDGEAADTPGTLADAGDAADADDVGRCAGCDDGFGRVASRPGSPLKSPAAGAASDNRCDPSRLRALRALRADACPAARYARRRCRAGTFDRSFDCTLTGTAAFSSRRRSAPRSSPQHVVRRRCRLRRPPARAPPGASPASLVRALLRSERAVASAQVRTSPPALPSPRCARPHAASAARPAAQAPRRLPSAGFPGVDFPIPRSAPIRLRTGHGRPWGSHPTHR